MSVARPSRYEVDGAKMIEIRRNPARIVVTLNAEPLSYDDSERAARQLIAVANTHDCTNVIVDFCRTMHCQSILLGAIITAALKATRLTIVNVTRATSEKLRMLRLDKVCGIHVVD